MNTVHVSGLFDGVRSETTPSGYEFKTLHITALQKKRTGEQSEKTYEFKIFNPVLAQSLEALDSGVSSVVVIGAVDSNVSQKDGRVFCSLIANQVLYDVGVRGEAAPVVPTPVQQRPVPQSANAAHFWAGGRPSVVPGAAVQQGAFNIPKSRNTTNLPPQFEDDDIPF